MHSVSHILPNLLQSIGLLLHDVSYTRSKMPIENYGKSRSLYLQLHVVS